MIVRLGVAALLAVFVLVPAASAQTQTLVKGKGSSPAAGFVSVNARGDVTNAKGKFRGRDLFGVDLFGVDLGKGRVTCVDPFPFVPGRANVGGVLKRPIVFQGQTFTHFVFQVHDGGPGQPDFARTFTTTEAFFGEDCGFLLWFDNTWDPRPPGALEFLRVTGDFVVSSRPARFDVERDQGTDDA